jgi:hypothetical protein
MALSVARGGVFCSMAILFSTGWLPLIAQSSDYHLEFADRVNGPARVILVNDSEKSIEAYYPFQRCKSGATYYGGQDVLDVPGVDNSLHGAGGSGPRSVLEPGGRWETVISPSAGSTSSVSTSSGSTSGDGAERCEPRIDAIIFADGSFDGNAEFVKALKARRDGTVAAVNYWADRFSHENPDGSGLGVLLADANRLYAEDGTRQRKYRLNLPNDDPPPLLREYWHARFHVDQNVAHFLAHDLSKETASENLHLAAGFIDEWKKKIDSDAAMRKLNSEFPPITESAGN